MSSMVDSPIRSSVRANSVVPLNHSVIRRGRGPAEFAGLLQVEAELHRTRLPEAFTMSDPAGGARLEARETGVRVLFGDRRVLTRELPDHSRIGHLDAVGVDA